MNDEKNPLAIPSGLDEPPQPKPQNGPGDADAGKGVGTAGHADREPGWRDEWPYLTDDDND